MNSKTTLWVGIAALLLLPIFGYYFYYISTPGQFDDFAVCLEEKGAVFYGAFWCPHCQSQKKLFGKSASKLPYVECSQPSGSGQLPICVNKKVESYPTWEFADGSRMTGEISLKDLASTTGCTLPQASR